MTTVNALHNLFQSTPPVRGATPSRYAWGLVYILFQSTPPVRGATDCGDCLYEVWNISIHAPRAGGDQSKRIYSVDAKDFNPRPPCGGRP